MKKHKIIYLGTGLIIFAILLAGVISFKINQIIPQEKFNIHKEEIKDKVILVINNGDGLPQIFQSEYQERMTAFDLLRKKTEELNLFLKTKSYDIGIFIEAIGNKENRESGKYWLYYVNGEMPMVASDKKEIKAGDKVEFKFEKSMF